MEQASMVVQIVQTVGFPAAMCLMMGYFLYMETNAHKSEMNDLKDVIAKNNEVLAQLKQLIQDKLRLGEKEGI